MFRIIQIIFWSWLIFQSLSVYAAEPDIAYVAGQMMMVGFNGTSVDDNSTIVKEIRDYHIGGIILDTHRAPHSKKLTTNIQNPQQLKKMISQLQGYAKQYGVYPLLIAINQEGGIINTLKPEQGFMTDNDLSQYQLGKKKDPQTFFIVAYKRAVLLKSLGINFNLAPVADLAINPNNPAVSQLERSFGSHPEDVTDALKETIAAYRKANLLCALKHFPGLGSASQNTDYAKADLTKTWSEKELQPYQSLIRDKQSCPFIMTTHLINYHLDSKGLPASLSKKIVTDLLIKKMHYQGVIITDDMDAAAIRKHVNPQLAIKQAVLAGNNVIIYGGTQGYDPDADADFLYHELLNLAKKNNAAKKQMMTSYHKIIAVKKQII